MEISKSPLDKFFDWMIGLIQKAFSHFILETLGFRELIKRKSAYIEEIDPRDFHADPIAKTLGIPHFLAELLCRIAVRQGRFGIVSSSSAERRTFSVNP